jgi:hypothetical protein
MLRELSGMQNSPESVQAIELSFDIETSSEDDGEVVHRTYTFDYAKSWDKWTFIEFQEKRAAANERVGDRNWRESRHILWHDAEQTPTVDVPPEVSTALQEATGADAVTIQTPSETINEK